MSKTGKIETKGHLSKITFPTIGIIGYGTVGKAMEFVWGSHHVDKRSVKVYDKAPGLSRNSLQDTIASDYVFICINPSTDAIRRQEAFYILHSTIFQPCEKLLCQLVSDSKAPHIFIKSTLPVGTTDKLLDKTKYERLYHYPEFLTERKAQQDASFPMCNVLGIRLEDGNDPLNSEKVNTVKNIIVNRFPIGRTAIYPPALSEMTKLACNAFYATKVSFFNEMARFCKVKGVMFESLVQAMLLQGWIHPMHTRVPGPDGLSGYGGKCLPKDIRTLALQLIEEDIKPCVLSGAIYRNVIERG